ncbi:MAG: TIGR01212 family radical SAM protein [Planctomycetaceae bacterium]|jgi:radical SAM protein (TIGR01212 family)|nr:TIGR01212 family radical SAM protein [Planctomycetaceae bacterium]
MMRLCYGVVEGGQWIELLLMVLFCGQSYFFSSYFWLIFGKNLFFGVMSELIPFWRLLGHDYFPLGVLMRREFGCSVWKVSVDIGCSCPNIDGTVGTGGCLFCNTSSFAPSRRFREPVVSIVEQIDVGIRQLKRRYRHAQKFIAYFQPSTNTHLELEDLERFCRLALGHRDVVGLAIGTRPDALPEEVLEMLGFLSRTAWVQLEIGLQSIHQKSLDFLNRGHDYLVFRESFRRCRRHGFRLGVHLILGIPGESREEVLATAQEMAFLQPDSIKLHHLYVVRETPLEKLWRAGEIRLTTLEEYAGLVVDFLEELPPTVVVERIAGEADALFLLAPEWTGNKHAARNAVNQEFQRRCSFQGRLWLAKKKRQLIVDS